MGLFTHLPHPFSPDLAGMSESTEHSFNMSSEYEDYYLEEKKVFQLDFRCSLKGVHRLSMNLPEAQRN